MASMNKPALGSTSWYQQVTDNWTAIENNYPDKTLVTTKGDLISASAASTPVRVAVGADGQFLKADSTQSNGLAWTNAGSVSVQDVIDVLWGNRFFLDEGILPSNKMFEYIGTPPAFAGTAGSATWTREPGAARPNSSGIAWYDMGNAYSKILIVVGNMLKLSNNIAVMLTSSAPTGLDPDGYSMWNDTNGPAIYKRAGGIYTRLDSGTGFSNTDYRCGYALYYDDDANIFRMYLRFGGQWMLAQTAEDSTYTTFRYIALQAAAANQRWVTPFVCYAR
jgi:hypothetical protein